jgi:hypothetical protein
MWPKCGPRSDPELVDTGRGQTKTPPERGFRESPLPDSNRRPLPYHGSRATTRGAHREQKYLQRGPNGHKMVVRSVAQRSARALPNGYPGARQARRRQARIEDGQPRRRRVGIRCQPPTVARQPEGDDGAHGRIGERRRKEGGSGDSPNMSLGSGRPGPSSKNTPAAAAVRPQLSALVQRPLTRRCSQRSRGHGSRAWH